MTDPIDIAEGYSAEPYGDGYIICHSGGGRAVAQLDMAAAVREITRLRAALAQAGAGEPAAEIVTVRHFHEYEGSALEDATGYLVTSVRLLGPEPIKEGTRTLYFGVAHPSPAQREPLSEAQICSMWDDHTPEWPASIRHIEYTSIARQIEAACAAAWGVKLADSGTKETAS